MKLFLSSMAIADNQVDAFAELVGKDPQDITLALIENAADPQDSEEADWVDRSRAEIIAQGYQVELVDLRDYLEGGEQKLKDKLASKDVIWLGGGNTFYLRWILEETGADAIIKELVKRGAVYGGGSAGAIVAGPTLKFFEAVDDPNDSPEVVIDGLHLTEVVVVPHMANEKYGPIMEDVERFLREEGYETAPLTDSQALLIDGEKLEVIS